MSGAGRQQQSSTSELAGGPASQVLSYHPAFDRSVRLTRFTRPIPESDESTTAQTVGVMAEMVRRDSAAPPIRQALAAAIAGSSNASGDPENVAAAIHQWIREHVRFVQDSTLAGFDADPDAAEVLVRPIDLLAMPEPQGDCDDFSMLAAAMLRAAGIRSAFKTVAADATSPDYSHVYVLALLPSGPTPLDASHGPYLGWETRAAGKSRIWPIDDKETNMKNLRGLGFDWDVFGSVVSAGMNDATKILAPRYAVPQLNPGQYIQQGNNVMYQQPAGGSAAFGLPIAGAGGNSMLYLLGGLAVVLLLVTRSK